MAERSGHYRLAGDIPLPRRFPLAPLLAIAEVRSHATATMAPGCNYEGGTVNEMARVMKTSPRNLHRWLKDGELSWWSADECATGLGVHPVEVWGDQWIEAVA